MRAVSVAAESKASKAVVLGERWVQIRYVTTDLVFVAINAVIVFSFRFPPDWGMRLLWGITPLRPFDVRYPFLDEYLAFLLLYGALTVLCCQSQGLYHVRETRSPVDEGIAVAKALLTATLLLTAFIYLSGIKTVSRLVVSGTAVLTLATLVAWRWWRRQGAIRRVAQGHGVRNVLIVGANKVGQELAQYLEANKHLGYVVKGFLDDSSNANSRVLGGVEDLTPIAQAQFADEVFVTIPSEREVVKKLVVEGRLNRLEVKVVPELYDGLGWRTPIEQLGDFPVMALHREPIPVLGLLIKRLIDITVAAVGLFVISPLLASIALAIRLDSHGPILYRSVRVGRKGRHFTCYKFRTMVADADGLKEALRHLNERRGPFFKIENDPRLTRVGRWLRKYSLDELPQLCNVLKGEMSLVGPRPHPLDDYHQYALEHLRRLDAMPGITGLWQVSARRDPSFEKNLALDLQYIENWSVCLDLAILLKTIPTVLLGRGQ